MLEQEMLKVEQNTALEPAASESSEMITLLRQMRDELAEQNRRMKKQLFATRLMAAALAVLAVAVIFTITSLAPMVNDILIETQAAIQNADAAIAQTEVVLTNLEQTTAELKKIDFEGVVNNMNNLITETEKGLSAALAQSQAALYKIQQIDIDKLNQSINSLYEVIQPLKRILNIF